MRKLLLLVLMSLLLLAACTFDFNLGSDEEDKGDTGKTENVVKDEEKVDTEDPVADEEDQADTDSGEVVIEIPNGAFEGLEEEDILAFFAMDGIEDVTANDDGTYTLRMTKAEQEELLETLMADAISEIDELIAAFAPDSIVEASPNNTLTELHVMFDMDLYDGDLEGFVLDDFSYYGMSYQIYAGIPIEESSFEIVYLDAATGEEFERHEVTE